jgi:hypothetical protein
MKTRLMMIQTILVLAMAPAAWAAKPCGLHGTLEERIRSCSESSGEEYQLVTRTRDGLEIHYGKRTGVIWSADLPGPLTYQADEVETICEGDHPEFGGLTGFKWVLPSIHRYIQGLHYGIQSSLPGADSLTYWTSTADRFYVTDRYVFDGSVSYSTDSSGRYTFRHLETDFPVAHVKCIVETLE